MPLEAALPSAALALRPLAAGFGAEVSGIDLALPLQAAVAEVLHDALIEHGVLLLRGQRVGTPELARLGTQLAEIEAHALGRGVHQVPGPAPRLATLDVGEAGWQSGGSAAAEPAILSLAIADTGRIAFADQRAAAARLPAEIRSQIEPLRALHRDGEQHRTAELPLLRQHPITGEAALLVSPAEIGRVLNRTPAESQDLLSRLLAAATEVTWQHTWAPGDVLLWDHRRVLHSGTVGSGASVTGDRPTGLAALDMAWVSAG